MNLKSAIAFWSLSVGSVFWGIGFQAQSPELIHAYTQLALESGWESVLDGMPSTYNFSYDGGNNSISDGGGDMYDGGNNLSINGTSINYTGDNLFNVGSTFYFTLQKPGMFLLAADMTDMSSFAISGNLGADGSGSTTGWTLSSEIGKSFFRRVCNAGDPSVNHLFVIPSDAVANQSYSSSTDSDNHSLDISSSTNGVFVYVLWAGSGGYCYDEEQTFTVQENLEALGIYDYELVVPGCLDVTACNFVEDATVEDGSCSYPDLEYDCSGNCLNDLDEDGVCDEFEILGCTDVTSANFNPQATDDDGSCGPLGALVDTLYFVPATIDSMRSSSLAIVNQLSTPQTVTIDGISPPFYGESTIEVNAFDTAFLNVDFVPLSVSLFTQNLELSGSAFGTDQVVLVGEGTLPEGIFLEDTLDFGSVSVNSYATEHLPILSSGLGSLVVDSIVTSSPLVFGPVDFVIPEGDTLGLPITFYSELSGVYAVDLTIYTSDPFNSVRQAHCIISAISEVGGEVCGTWSLINSPYLLIDDVIVPEGCSLTIEPGVLVSGNAHNIEVFGELYAQGIQGAEIVVELGELISHTHEDHLVLSHTQLSETNECLFSDTDIIDVKLANPYSDDSLAFWLDEKGSIYPFDLDWYFDFDFFNLESTIGLANGELHGYLVELSAIMDSIAPPNEFGLHIEDPVVYQESFGDNNAQGWTTLWSNYTGTSSYSGF